jgi:hypothetical protein
LLLISKIGRKSRFLMSMDPKYYKLLKRFTVAFLLPWLLSGQSEAQTAPIKVPCGNTGIMVELPTSWEAVATQHPFVRCAFRNPSSGFPTFNILEEPKPAGFDPSKERQESELLRSYRLAGLTDAAVISSENITIDERPAYQAVVRYTSAGKAMTAVVTIYGNSARLDGGLPPFRKAAPDDRAVDSPSPGARSN